MRPTGTVIQGCVFIFCSVLNCFIFSLNSTQVQRKQFKKHIRQHALRSVWHLSMVIPTVRKCAPWKVYWMKKQKNTNSLEFPPPKVTNSWQNIFIPPFWITLNSFLGSAKTSCFIFWHQHLKLGLNLTV